MSCSSFSVYFILGAAPVIIKKVLSKPAAIPFNVKSSSAIY
jgi:hypothetical protein